MVCSIPIRGKKLQEALYLSVWCLDIYTSRHHTDKYSANIHKQITYHHKPEHGEICRLTRSNYARHKNGPLIMVGGLTETCWVLSQINLSTQHTCVVLNVNCESVFN